MTTLERLSLPFEAGDNRKVATVACFATIQNEGERSISRQIADDCGMESLKVISPD